MKRHLQQDEEAKSWPSQWQKANAKQSKSVSDFQ